MAPEGFIPPITVIVTNASATAADLVVVLNQARSPKSARTPI